jgi:hypothetical protein
MISNDDSNDLDGFKEYDNDYGEGTS